MTTSTETSTDTPDETPPPVGPDDRAARRRTRRALRWGLAILVALLALVAAGTAIVGLGVKTDAEAARAEMTKGQRALAQGDLDAASERFREAQVRFDAASERAGSGIGAVLGSIPLLGRSIEVASGISEAGSTLAGAAVDLTEAIEALPGGLGALAPVDGRIPVDLLGALAGDVEAAAAQADEALATVRSTPSTYLPATVAEIRFEAEEAVTDASRALDSATALTNALPSFAGAEGERSYLLIAESPSEQRGTGGIWGAYAILTADGGDIEVGPFAPILTLPEASPDEVPAPNPDYRRNYDQYGGAGSWRDMNMTPDFPSAARAALATYEHGTGESLDGVIVADPFALEELLRVAGPIEIPELGVTVGARDVVRFVANEAYILFPNAGKERKAVLGAVVGGAFEEFLSGGGNALGKVEAITRSVARGHLRVYSTDPGLERGLRLAALDGALDAPAGDDLLAVHVNSRSANKVDYYVTRSVAYGIELGGDREAIATTEVTLRNDAPTSGVPGYVIDPGKGIEGHEPGDAVSIVTASCPGPCEMLEAQRNGKDRALRVGEELDRPWYQDVITTPGGDTSTLRIVTSRNGTWTGNSSGGTYRLTIVPQTTIVPTEVTVSVTPPPGTEVVWTSEPMRIVDGRAEWRDAPEGRVQLVVRFRAPLPLRWWRNAERLVG